MIKLLSLIFPLVSHLSRWLVELSWDIFAALCRPEPILCITPIRYGHGNGPMSMSVVRFFSYL